MAKLTKRQNSELARAHNDLKRALEWIHSDSVLVCRRGDNTTLAYVNRDGERIGPICKECGSPLQFIENALHKLERLQTTTV